MSRRRWRGEAVVLWRGDGGEEPGGGRERRRWSHSPHEELLHGVLVENGADVDKADDRERTPLWAACSGGHLDLATLIAISLRGQKA